MRHRSRSFLRKQNRIRLWLYEDTRMQIEGVIIGFDEYMNFVLDEAVEIDSAKKTRQEVGRILLKGDSITMLQEAQPVRQASQEAE
jgi:small nuclear ribonucleoprotein E